MHKEKHIGESEKSQPVTFAPLSLMEVSRTESDFLSQFLIDKLAERAKLHGLNECNCFPLLLSDLSVSRTKNVRTKG